MWALSAQLSIAQSDKTINTDVFLPTCVYEFTYEHELNGSLSHFSFCYFFVLFFFLK
jgi:hypothetical protein